MNKHYKALELDKILNMLVDRCVSKQAKERAFNLEPESSLSAVQVKIDQTNDAYKLISSFKNPGFEGVKDITDSLNRAKAGGLLCMGELLKVARLLTCVRQIIAWKSTTNGMITSLDQIFESLTEQKTLEKRILDCIISEEEMADSASDTLFTIRRKIASQSNKIRMKLDSLIKSSSTQKYLQDAVITQRNSRFVVPVKLEHKSEIAGLIHDTSSSGATVFIEPLAVVEANNEIRILESQEKEEIERILFELGAKVSEEAASIEYNLETMIHLDLIFAKAKLGLDMKASVPILNDKGIIELRKARHPLLNKSSVVPVDVKLGSDYQMLVITGPNTGGKTVTIKTVGLISLMTMCGLLIPCFDNSKVSVFNNVFADIGDEQSIEHSLSTFSSHMKNIIDILDKADNKSLVLLDELCSGTDPIEGAALAMSILESLKESGSIIAATTHYAGLKAYALDTKGVENASCEFDVQTLSPTYRLLIGVPGRSNAFAISNRLGMNQKIVERASSYISAEDSKFERVIQNLENERKLLEDKQQETQRSLLTAKKLEQEANEKTQKLKEIYDKEIEAAKEKARVISDNAQYQVNKILDELERIKKEEKHNINLAKQTVSQGFKKLDEIATSSNNFDENYVLPRPLEVGDNVLLAQSNQKAIVISLPDKKGIVKVQAGLMKMKVDLKGLRLLEKEKSAPAKSTHRKITANQTEKTMRQSLLEVDVRGKTVDEAEFVLDQFIDSCVLSGLTHFTLIHGKGTGALRAGLHKHLRSHRCVRSFRLGIYGEGEDGVTIVELK